MTEFKNVLLTGASGFIGRNISEQLGHKYNLYAPSRQSLDLLDQKSVIGFFNQNKIDVVVHAAAVAVGKKTFVKDSTDKNIQMFFNLIDVKDKWRKMIFLGSGAEYDKRQDLKMVKEEDFGKSIPDDEYGLAKYSCSKYIETADNIINLRCFGVYGKYEDSDQRFISTAILDTLSGRPISIKQNVFFDYLFVDNLVKIIDYFINHQAKFKFYNAVSGHRVDLLTLAGVVEKVSSSKQGIMVLNDGLGKEYTADNARLKKEIPELGFASLETGITKLYQYYLYNK